MEILGYLLDYFISVAISREQYIYKDATGPIIDHGFCGDFEKMVHTTLCICFFINH